MAWSLIVPTFGWMELIHCALHTHMCAFSELSCLISGFPYRGRHGSRSSRLAVVAEARARVASMEWLAIVPTLIWMARLHCAPACLAFLPVLRYRNNSRRTRMPFARAGGESAVVWYACGGFQPCPRCAVRSGRIGRAGTWKHRRG